MGTSSSSLLSGMTRSRCGLPLPVLSPPGMRQEDASDDGLAEEGARPASVGAGADDEESASRNDFVSLTADFNRASTDFAVLLASGTMSLPLKKVGELLSMRLSERHHDPGRCG